MATNNGFSSEYDFANKHVDTTLNPSKDLISSAKCLIYARPSSFGSEDNSGAVKFYRCGLIQSYSYQEQRDINRIFEIGSDVPYVIPGRTMGSLGLSRIMLFGSDLVNILYYSSENEGITNEEHHDIISAIHGAEGTENIIRSINDIKKPIDILVTYYKEATDDSKAARYSRVFKQCMITSRSESVGANNIIVGEDVQIVFAKMGPVKL